MAKRHGQSHPDFLTRPRQVVKKPRGHPVSHQACKHHAVLGVPRTRINNPLPLIRVVSGIENKLAVDPTGADSPQEKVTNVA